MISNKRLQHIDFIARTIVADFFASMCNPKYRGEKFSWDKFPDIVAGFCETQYFMSLNKEYKNVDLWAKKCAELGKEFAKRLIKNAGFLEK